MNQAPIEMRRAMFAATVSALALAVAAPAHAQDTTSSDSTPPQTSVTPNQIAGEVGPAQERTGTADQSNDIIVTGIRASIQASLNQKRRADVVSEVITAQDIGKFPDKNVADSLGRLTGVDVVTGSASAGGFGENSSVSIRGTDPALNLTLLDGHAVATGDWFVLDQQAGGRSFDYSLLPSEVVGSLEVYKSSEADVPEGGIGGTINIHSRMPLDLPAGSFSLTAQGNYNDLAQKWAPQVSGLASWKNESGTFGVLATGFYQERYFRRDGQEFLGYEDVANFDGTGQTVSAPLLIGSSYFTQKRVRKGGTMALQYKPSSDFELDINGLYSRMDANNVNTNSMAWVSTLLAANSTPGTPAYTLKDYTVTNGYLTAASWGGTTADGSPVKGRVQDDIFRDAYSSTWDLNADATWHVGNVKLTGQVGYTEGKGATTDTFAWETYWLTGMNYQFQGKGAAVNYPDLPSDPTSAAYLDNYYSWSWGGKIVSPDKEFYAKADAEADLGDGFLKSLKVGARYTNHKHSLIYDAYSWAGNGLYSGTQGVNLGTVFDGDTTPADYNDRVVGLPPYSLANKDLVLQELATNGGRHFDFYPQASFSVKEQTEAFYAMAKFDNDSDWRGNIGLRTVHTDQDTIQYSPSAAVANTVTAFCATCGTVEVKRGYWDVLPSLNVTYSVRPDLLLRGGVAKVMTRPGYAQLAGAVTLSDTIETGTAGGNPYLNPYRAWQFNAAAEWYYGKQSLFSIDLFYLDISNYITTQTFHQFFITQQHPNGAIFTLTGPINGAGGTNKGVEVNWQQPVWGGFGFLANYTYSDAKADDGGVIPGNSKNTYNLTGYFENSLISARLAYTFRSKFESGIDRATPMWQDDFGSLDGSLIVNVTKNVALTADAQNILDKKLYYFVGNPAIPRAYYDNGRTIWVGAKVTF